MLHWTPRGASTTVTSIGAFIEPTPAPRSRVGEARADHARMLAHAAKRRRAAQGDDRAYWIACAPAAVAKAAAIRAGAGFAPLP